MEINLSKTLFLYNAARIPRKRAKGTEIRADTLARNNVLENRQPISSTTDLPVVREFPSSPVKTPFSHEM